MSLHCYDKECIYLCAWNYEYLVLIVICQCFLCHAIIFVYESKMSVWKCPPQRITYCFVLEEENPFGSKINSLKNIFFISSSSWLGCSIKLRTSSRFALGGYTFSSNICWSVLQYAVDTWTNAYKIKRKLF